MRAAMKGEFTVDKYSWVRGIAILFLLLVLLGLQGAVRAAFPNSLANNNSSPSSSGDLDRPDAPTNVNTITGESSSNWPLVSQDESAVWANGNKVVVHYVDQRLWQAVPTPGVACYVGLSYSSDGGATFTRLLPCPICSGHGTTLGDPSLIYNKKLSKWFAADITAAFPAQTTPTVTPQPGECGRQGVGLWESSDGAIWSVGSCVNQGDDDDHPLMWVDNNCESPYFGRIYVAWLDPPVGVIVAYSDDGSSWQTPTQPINNPTYLWTGSIVTSPGADGTVFVTARSRDDSAKPPILIDYIFRSTDGGTTWSQATQVGSARNTAGERPICGSGYGVRPNWLLIGAAQLGVGPDGVVHLVYEAPGQGTDVSDIYYARSTDNGATWSTPTRFNTDTSSREQWMPSIAVTNQGAVFASWYDRRDTATGSYNYKYWGRVSTDNGATWQSDYQISDVEITNPSDTPDLSGIRCRQGEYYTHSAGDNIAYFTWDDGRNTLTNASGTPYPQPDVYFAKATATASICQTQFTDVNLLNPFYYYIRCLACRGIVGGYPCGGPNEACRCYNNAFFRPYNTTTRAQTAKIVAQAANFTDPIPSTQQTFQDVPPTDTFWIYIERLYVHGVVSGYPCGGSGEPCIPPANRPYFRPSNTVTRGQLAKMVAQAASFTETVPSTQQTFQDVPSTDTFWLYVERLYDHNAVVGYSCGSTGEPCVPPANRPYYRPYTTTTRGQTAKIVSLSFLPACAPGSPDADQPIGKPEAPASPPALAASSPTNPVPTATASLPTPIGTVSLPSPVPTGSVLPHPVPTSEILHGSGP